jgi:hypothetical protein
MLCPCEHVCLGTGNIQMVITLDRDIPPIFTDFILSVGKIDPDLKKK